MNIGEIGDEFGRHFKRLRSASTSTIHNHLLSPTKAKPDRLYTIGFAIDSVPFTADVVDGKSSLGGSESACLDLARGLGARGHDVHMIVSQLSDDVRERPLSGKDTVTWHHAEELPSILPFFDFDVFVSLRMPQAFALRNPAKLTALWAQDLLTGPGAATTSFLSQVDRLIYVSEFHRAQWQGKEPSIRNLPSWVVTNAFNPLLVPKTARLKQPYLIHTSRPERGHDALIHLWPFIREACPGLELKICRYSSMYDAKGFGRVCAAFDRKIEELNKKVGGITYLGELSKPELYYAISGAVAMLYPTSQPWFAETNCLAATEAQACGTPIIADKRGAIPETVGAGAGILLDNPGGGEHWKSDEYRDAVLAALTVIFNDPDGYQSMREAGFAKAATCALDVQAEVWENKIDDFFATRYQSQTLGILRRLLHDDDHGAAQVVAQRIYAEETRRHPEILQGPPDTWTPAAQEACRAAAFCDDVIAQRASTAQDYSDNAIQDPVMEAKTSGRFVNVCDFLTEHLSEEVRQSPLRVLDLACGNGSGIIKFSELLPNASFIGIDYSPGVLRLAQTAVDGIADLKDRAVFYRGYWNAEAKRWQCSDSELDKALGADLKFDLIFCGEFLEHVLHPEHVLDGIERLLAPGGLAVLTTPCGPFTELMPGIKGRNTAKKGHVHDYTVRDIAHLLSTKGEAGWSYLPVGNTVMGSAVGYWLIWFEGRPLSRQIESPALDLEHKILTARPYQRIDACLIVKNGADWLRPCLKSLEACDRILVTDTGSTDGSQDLCRELGAEVTEIPWPEDFSVARNESIKRSLQGSQHPDGAEWVLWIDADERMDGANRLRQYAHGGGCFNGIAIRQHHLHIDQNPYFDTPVRLFRTEPLTAHRPEDAGAKPQFYGVIHEQPEIVFDHGLTPALLISNINIVHMGYYHGEIRRTKSLQRNQPLLLKEIDGKGTHPPRRIAWAFLMRDLLQSVLLYRGPAQRVLGDKEPLTAQDRARLARVIQLYREHKFEEPGNLIHDFAFNLYQQALMALEITKHGGLQVAWAFGASRGEIRAPKPRVFFAMSTEEAEKLIAGRVHQWMEALQPEKYRTAPYIPGDDDLGPSTRVKPLSVFASAEADVESGGSVPNPDSAPL